MKRALVVAAVALLVLPPAACVLVPVLFVARLELERWHRDRQRSRLAV